MSKLVDQCKAENDRAQMLETAEEDEDSDDQDINSSPAANSQAVVLYEEDNTKLTEAQELLNHILDQKDAFEKGEPLPIEAGDDSEMYEASMSQADSDIEERQKLSKQEGDLKSRLDKQEQELAQIMKEIQEKEDMLKKAREECDQFLTEEQKADLDNQEMTPASAASKFSSMRSNIIRSDKVVNSQVPEDKIIQEMPEEEDEDDSRLDTIINNAQQFTMNFEHEQSTSQLMDPSNKTPLYQLLEDAKTDEEAQKI